MITPQEIREKADRLYPKAIAAWLADELDFFPRLIPANTEPSKVHIEAIQEVQRLQSGSKEQRGFGYSITWENRKSRTHGEQRFPQSIFFDSLDDLLRLINKQTEFRRLERCIVSIRNRLPALQEWGDRHWKRVIAIEPMIEELIQVVEYLLQNPRPGCFPRELPLAISTKAVEQNQVLLSEWLDLALPPSSIRWEYTRAQFAERYGFRSRRDHFLVRVLDEKLLDELRFPGLELSLPIETIASLLVENVTVMIVENKTNLLTLPMQERTIAIGGLGHGISQFFDVSWFEKNTIQYWGDLDTDGFLILAALRRRFPKVQSLMMDQNTLDKFASLATSGNGQTPEAPEELTDKELRAFLSVRENNRRLEQERIPQSYVLELLK